MYLYITSTTERELSISEQWTLAHYSSRERLINESHKLSTCSACSALHDGETDGETMLLDRRTHVWTAVLLLTRLVLGPIDILLLWSRPVRIQPRRISYLSPATAIMYCTYRLFCVYISRIYLYIRLRRLLILIRAHHRVSICSLPFALA